MSNRSSSLVLQTALALAVILWSMAGAPAGASAGEKAKEFAPSHMYAVNLASSLKPFDPSTLPRESLDKYLVYTTSFRKGGLTWHRLRVGFFPTKEAAKEAMRPLLKDFPKAWVTRVSAGERAKGTSAAP
jgi:septal ring-binding cell division protein DamX